MSSANCGEELGTNIEEESITKIEVVPGSLYKGYVLAEQKKRSKSTRK